jgi:hypothetical protein
MLLHLNIAQARHCNFFGTLVRSLQEKPGGTLLSTQILPIWWSRIIKRDRFQVVLTKSKQLQSAQNLTMRDLQSNVSGRLMCLHRRTTD